MILLCQFVYPYLNVRGLDPQHIMISLVYCTLLLCFYMIGNGGSVYITNYICRPCPTVLDNLTFMSSRSTVASSVSCVSGNKGNFSVLILPGFLGGPVVCVNFQLFKAIVRIPSSSIVLGICGGSQPQLELYFTFEIFFAIC